MIETAYSKEIDCDMPLFYDTAVDSLIEASQKIAYRLRKTQHNCICLALVCNFLFKRFRLKSNMALQSDFRQPVAKVRLAERHATGFAALKYEREQAALASKTKTIFANPKPIFNLASAICSLMADMLILLYLFAA